jgi:hypothetical protein
VTRFLVTGAHGCIGSWVVQSSCTTGAARTAPPPHAIIYVGVDDLPYPLIRQATSLTDRTVRHTVGVGGEDQLLALREERLELHPNQTPNATEAANA